MRNLYKNMNLHAKGTWFPIICGIILLTFVILMPKRLKNREIYFTFGVVGYVATMFDVFIMATVLDVFDLGSPDIAGIGDVISYGVVSSCLAVIFLNFYKVEKKWIYTGLFSLISFLYEITFVNLGYMELKGWRSIFSIPVHLISYGLWFPWHLKLMRK